MATGLPMGTDVPLEAGAPMATESEGFPLTTVQPGSPVIRA